MKLVQLAQKIGAHIVSPPVSGRDEIQSVYAGDRMSDLLSAVSDETLLVTHIANRGLLSLIELMDVPAVCLVNGAAPEATVVEAAANANTALLISPWGLYETCGRLYVALRNKEPGEGHD
jgi:hypothetical protein